MYKIKYSKYDTRVTNGAMARGYGFKLWHGARNRDTGQRWRAELWFNKDCYFIWCEKQ